MESVLLPSPCAVVCHDAGSANVIRAWLGADHGSHHFHVSGPAKAIFAANPVRGHFCATFEEALAAAPTLVSGTGWSSDVEHQARKLASARGLRSIAVLDHWVNYRARFERGGETVLPDEFWVTDSKALELACQAFPGSAVVLKPNLYVEELVRAISAGPAENAGEILFLLEPARDNWGRDKAGEFQALDYFVEALPKLVPDCDVRVRLRPHPSDARGKYDAWMASHAGRRIECTPPSEPLAVAISRAALVVGCQSYAMVVALRAGKRVLCALPPWAPRGSLPFPEIQYLSAL